MDRAERPHQAHSAVGAEIAGQPRQPVVTQDAEIATRTVLQLDTPEAAEALARCYRLLRKWASEAEDEREVPLEVKTTIPQQSDKQKGERYER